MCVRVYVAIKPLIQRLEDRAIRQVWFADDATAGGDLAGLRTWWEKIPDIGPEYGQMHPRPG